MFRNKVTIYSDFPVTIQTNPENKIKFVYTGEPGLGLNLLTVIHNQTTKRMSLKSYIHWVINQFIGLYREFKYQMSLDIKEGEWM